jgi:hypothetical protein
LIKEQSQLAILILSPLGINCYMEFFSLLVTALKNLVYKFLVQIFFPSHCWLRSYPI